MPQSMAMPISQHIARQLEESAAKELNRTYGESRRILAIVLNDLSHIEVMLYGAISKISFSNKFLCLALVEKSAEHENNVQKYYNESISLIETAKRMVVEDFRREKFDMDRLCSFFYHGAAQFFSHREQYGRPNMGWPNEKQSQVLRQHALKQLRKNFNAPRAANILRDALKKLKTEEMALYGLLIKLEQITKLLKREFIDRASPKEVEEYRYEVIGLIATAQRLITGTYGEEKIDMNLVKSCFAVGINRISAE